MRGKGWKLDVKRLICEGKDKDTGAGNLKQLLLHSVLCLVQISPSGPIWNENKQDKAAITLKGEQCS